MNICVFAHVQVSHELHSLNILSPHGLKIKCFLFFVYKKRYKGQ